MRYYIFRNNTLEPLFGNLDARYSGLWGLSPRWKRERIAISGSTRSLSGLIRCRVAEEVLSYIDKLRWVIEKIPAHKSVLVFSLVESFVRFNGPVQNGRYRRA